MKQDFKSGIYYRNKADELIINEVPGVYGAVPVQKGDVLLDLGGHIGLTTRLLLDKGVSRSIVVEADPANLRYLSRNLRRKNAIILWAAVGPKAGHTDFYTRADRGYVGSIHDKDGTRTKTVVPVVSFAGLLRKYRPTIVKSDIEFAEYTLPQMADLPKHVRVVAMEVHIRYIHIFDRPMTPDELRTNRLAAAAMIAGMEAQGFKEVRRKDKLAKVGEPPAAKDDSGIGPMVKAIDVIWAR